MEKKTFNYFVKKLKEFSPRLENLMNKGYDEKYSQHIIENHFNLETKKHFTEELELSVSNLIKFYNLSKFRVRNLFFSSQVDLGDQINVIAEFDGGVLAQIKEKEEVLIFRMDDLEADPEVFSQNDEDFFRILLLLSEYSGKIHNGEIVYSDESKSDYVSTCEDINPLCNFDEFF